MKKRTVWVIYTDTHNGATDFEVFGTEKRAEAAFVKTVNEVFTLDCKTFEEAETTYEEKCSNAFNDDWIRYEKCEVN